MVSKLLWIGLKTPMVSMVKTGPKPCLENHRDIF